MTRAFNYDNLLKCVSGLVLTAVMAVVIFETDLLPPQFRIPVRTAIHKTGDKLSRLPIVWEILQAFH
jgi:hypothetical protein